MRKIYLALVFLGALAIITAAALIWPATTTYFLGKGKKELLPETFVIQRGSVQKILQVEDGRIVAKKDFSLEFPFSGTVETVFVKEGDIVKVYDLLIKLETIDFELEINRLRALTDQSRANLKKLIAGPTKEDIDVSETQVKNAEVTLEDAKKNLVETIKDSYTRADNAVRNKADRLFTLPQSNDPLLKFALDSSKLENFTLEAEIKANRVEIENILKTWKLSLGKLSISGELTPFIKEAKEHLEKIRNFLDKLAFAVNGASASDNLPLTTLSSWRIDIAVSRADVNAVALGVETAEKNLNSAESALSLARRELDFKKSGTRNEDIEANRAEIRTIERQIDIFGEKIRKSTLRAPSTTDELIVKKIWLEPGELFKIGQSVISLSTLKQKLQVDVPEEDIRKISIGNSVLIRFDALPDKKIKGIITSIEPQEIIDDNDTSYRVNIQLEEADESVLAGMTADLDFLTLFKEDSLKIPNNFIYEKNNEKYVKVFGGLGIIKEIRIKTGADLDNNFIEVISGLGGEETIIKP